MSSMIAAYERHYQTWADPNALGKIIVIGHHDAAMLICGPDDHGTYERYIGGLGGPSMGDLDHFVESHMWGSPCVRRDIGNFYRERRLWSALNVRT